VVNSYFVVRSAADASLAADPILLDDFFQAGVGAGNVFDPRCELAAARRARACACSQGDASCGSLVPPLAGLYDKQLRRFIIMAETRRAVAPGVELTDVLIAVARAEGTPFGAYSVYSTPIGFAGESTKQVPLPLSLLQ
jgi:hypothetical protein